MLGQHLSQNMRNVFWEKFKNFFRISIFILYLVLESAVMITKDVSDSQKYVTIQKCWPRSRAWTLVLKLCSYWTIFRQHQRAQPKVPITFSICMLLRLPFVNWSSGLAHRSFHLSGTYYYFSITQVIAIH